MESAGVIHNRDLKKKVKSQSTSDYNDFICPVNDAEVEKNARARFLGTAELRHCPRCGKSMQKSGQKADSNGVIKQRFLCLSCKRTGLTPYNFFFPIERMY